MMRNTKCCPKCSGVDILMIQGNAGPYGVGNNIQVGWTNASAILVNRYVCLGGAFVIVTGLLINQKKFI